MVVQVFDRAAAGRTFILSRRDMREAELSPRMREGVLRVFGEHLSADDVVSRIIGEVRARGDAALKEYAATIDGVRLKTIEVEQDEIDAAFNAVPEPVIEALKLAADRIRAFHERQRVGSWIDFNAEGSLGQIMRPLERVGVYAPGGTAPYPSSLLMTAVPASVAGVEEIIVCAPPERHGSIAPVTAVAARIAGATRVFKVGGAQAIAAMAYGTETVPRVDKICGPGNIFVVLAKRQVYGQVAIDLLPGPTETVVIADDSTDPVLCAADLLAQAEHDPMASAILLTTSAQLAVRVVDEIEQQMRRLERASIARESLKTNGAVILVDNVESAIEIANDYAPEHLCLLVRDAWSYIGRVKHAGGIFVGEHSPEVLGDYTAGPSHVMPTGRTARFASPVNVMDFVKIISVIGMDRDALEEIGPAAATIARAEGLTAHANAIEQRLERMHPDE